MQYPHYQLSVSDENTPYIFESIGKNKKVVKLIAFTPIPDKPDFYNLSVGDFDPLSQTVSDSAITNNGDLDKLLNTIARAVEYFFDTHPTAIITAFGNSPARNRLYRMAINKHLLVIKQEYHLSGMQRNVWEHYRKDGNYIGFLIMKK